VTRYGVTPPGGQLFLDAQLAVTKDGLDGPTGRSVICGGGDPKPAELAIGALEIHAWASSWTRIGHGLACAPRRRRS
jgi:hypothetical protein